MVAKLEVVVFTHNHGAFVERAIASVLSQAADFEISLRIHDDASTDSTVEVINKVLSNSDISWQLTQAPENRYSRGISFFHEFIAESRAEFAAILDGDDFWIDNDKLQEQVRLLERFPAAALCHHPVMQYASGELTPIEWPPAEFRSEVVSGTSLTRQNAISTSSVVVRTSVFPRVMPEGFNDLRIGDYPMWSLTATGHDIAFLDRPMSAYRIHESNIWAALHEGDRFDQELAARIYIANSVPKEFRPQWRSGIVTAVDHHLRLARGPEENLHRLAETLERADAALSLRTEELLAAQRRTQHILESSSWRLTRPLRTIADAARRFKRFKRF